jgi:hypothetical protein
MKRHLNRNTSSSGGSNQLVTKCQWRFDPLSDTAFILAPGLASSVACSVGTDRPLTRKV